MSGICALFNLDGKPVARAEISAMTAMLARRGPDGTSQWTDGPVGLGHTLLATTPDSEWESQPFVHAESDCVISADVRLDNRSELIGLLAPGRSPGSIGDAELILLSYLKWGEDCPRHLLGDFAFVIRDPRHDRMFCARDHSGVRLLYYHHEPNRRIALGTSPKSILVLPQVPYTISQPRIADYLADDLEWIDYECTFFEGIFRLPPGHSITAAPDRFTLREYWRPDVGTSPGPLTDDGWREAFLEVFTKSVECRLRTPPGKVGSMLSGGMDSGTVVAVAADLLTNGQLGPLPTYSGSISPDPAHVEAREVDAIAAATSMSSIDPTVILPEDLHDQYAGLMADSEEPFDGQCVILKAMYSAAAADGRKVVLDGAAGDVIVGYGSYLTRLMRDGRILTATKEILAANRFWGGSSGLVDLFLVIRSVLAPDFIKRYRHRLRARNLENFISLSLISPEFAESVDIEDRVRKMRLLFPDDWEPSFTAESVRGIRPNMTGGRERYARLAAAAGTEASDPFMDKRVIEFCPHLPGHLRHRDGWPKMILRDVMQGRLPDGVLWATGKRHVGWVFNVYAARRAIDCGILRLESLQKSLKDYILPGRLAEAWRRQDDEAELEALHTVYALATWLDENHSRPVVPSTDVT